MAKKDSQENIQFIESIRKLSIKGIKDKVIAQNLGIDKQKIANIKMGRSTADIHLLRALYIAYPEISPEKEIVHQEEIDNLNDGLKKVLEELKTNNQLLREIKADLQKDETRSEAINRLSKIIEQQMKDEV